MSTILIVGGGFSGTALAVNLVRRSKDVRVFISRSAEGPEFGIAYQTNCPLHLLNVPARGMSAFPDQSTDFLEWAHKAGLELQPKDFAPRLVYRQYLQNLRDEALASGQVEVVGHETVHVQSNGEAWLCRLKDGQTLEADAVVLAFGGFQPALIPELSGVQAHPSMISNPWTEVEMDSDGVNDIGIIGSGLTALDVVLAFEAKGFQGRYTLLSRRGLMPHVHDLETPAFPAEELPPPNPRIRDLVRELRSAANRAEDFGTNWRAIVDGMRPKMSQYWQTLDHGEKLRFLRHVRSFWEVHRHRVAPAIADRITKLQAEGRLCVKACRIFPAVADGNQILVPCGPCKRRPVEEHRFDLLFNCTGPSSTVTSWPSPLIKDLLASGIGNTDRLQRGIDSDENGTVVGPCGTVRRGLHVLGHPRRGQLWESTAVPELRVQAAALASYLLR